MKEVVLETLLMKWIMELFYIDKVGLEEIITHHEAEFEVIDGYYYDQGRNNTIIHVIGDLYNLRLKLKQHKNPAQIVIKLLMNSIVKRLLNQWKQILQLKITEMILKSIFHTIIITLIQ